MKKNLIAVLGLMALILIVSFVVCRLPQHYAVRARPVRVARLARGDEAFVFIGEQRWGRSSNVATERASNFLPRALRDFVNPPDLLSTDAIAFHLAAGKLDRFELPNMATFVHFIISERRLCVVSSDYTTNAAASGFRWNDSEFVRLDPNEAAELLRSVLEPEITPSDDDESAETLSPFRREKEVLAGQGWDFKHFPTYGYKDKNLPIRLESAQFTLTFHAPPRPAEEGQDIYGALMPAGSIALSGSGLVRPEQTIYGAPAEWQRVTEAQYRALESPANRERRGLERPFWPLAYLSLIIYLLPALPFLAWLSKIVTLKRRILKNLPNSYAFPPARAEQFPKLDQQALEGATQGFEALGFVKLMDFSLVPDSGHYIPAFSRLMVHREHHCFVEIFQVFPPKKKPLALAYGINSNLHNGWSFCSGVRRTMALSYLMRLPKALWVCMPGAKPPELLPTHLARRSLIAHDLGVSVSTDISIEAYQASVLERHAQRRAAIQKKNIFFELGEALAFKLRPKSEWLGDYPRQAAQRREPWKYPARA